MRLSTQTDNANSFGIKAIKKSYSIYTYTTVAQKYPTADKMYNYSTINRDFYMYILPFMRQRSCYNYEILIEYICFL